MYQEKKQTSSFFNKIFTKQRIIWGSILLIIILTVLKFSNQNNESAHIFVIAKKIDLIQSISVTGNVEPTDILFYL